MWLYFCIINQMKLNKSTITGIASIIFLLILGISGLINNDSNKSTNIENMPITKGDAFLVKRVVDGDTIELGDGRTLRYIGIDTPETVKPNTPVQCFGKEASKKNKELVEGKYVTLEKDVNETDKYGRLLRYVYLDGVFINEQLVKEGYAHAASFPPDVSKQEQLKEAEKFARENNLGLWNSCESK